MTKRPEKGTPEYDLWVAAIEVAIFPPLTNARGQATSQVSWRRIRELRDALDALGLDWRTAKTKDDAFRAEQSKKQQDAARAERIEERGGPRS